MSSISSTTTPPLYVGSSSSSITFPSTLNYSVSSFSAGILCISPARKQQMMKLPIDKIPNLIYANGRLLTFGIVGSEADSFYLEKGYLGFSSTAFSVSINNSFSVSLQYSNKIYHYIIKYDANKTLLECKLLSEVNI